MFILLIEERDRREIGEFLISFVSGFKNVVFVSCSVLRDVNLARNSRVDPNNSKKS